MRAFSVSGDLGKGLAARAQGELVTTNPLFRTMQYYERLEIERQSPSRRLFISDYNGSHPYMEEYLGKLADNTALRLGDISRYAAIDEDLELRTRLADLHRRYDGITYSPKQVVPSGGSSSLIGSICTWLMLSGQRYIHYLPPVYYKFAFWFQRYGIVPVPVSDRHAFQSHFELRLPNCQTTLLLTDPIWYAGRRIPVDVLDEICAWQEATGSLVIVDGTFQYMRWDAELDERSANLLPDQTLRLVCPTKYLSLHGYRCAYLLAPERQRDELADLHLNLHGDVSLSDRLFAHRVCDVMDGPGNGALTRLAQDNYRRLVEAGAIGAHIDIETGYFLFTEINTSRERFLHLDQHSFELDGYPEHVRVNLLNLAAVDALLQG
jgi:aspartate/methionine/tyrosine aminotransferase